MRMRFGLGSILATLLALVLRATACAAPSPPTGGGHGVVTLSMHFDAPKEAAAAAFGPVSESVWAPSFQPQFVYPERPAQVAGAVFTTGKGRVWLLHDYDTAAGLVQYVTVDEHAAVTLTIHVNAAASGSDATMVYDIVALDSAGLDHIAEMQQHAHELSAHMQHAIGEFLKTPAR